MMTNNGKNGRMVFSTRSAVALWNHELLGQMSDGMWENSRPWEHYKYWCGIEVSCVSDTLPHPYAVFKNQWDCRKTSYNFAGLYVHIGERMLALGRMAMAVPDASYDVLSAVEYMPATFEEFLASPPWSDIATGYVSKVLGNVTREQAEKFYATVYTMKHLRADIKEIKALMKMAR